MTMCRDEAMDTLEVLVKGDPLAACDIEAIGVVRAEVERLQAIVDNLPKCWRLDDDGELVQDVPVVPGMHLYYFSSAIDGLGDMGTHIFWHCVGRDIHYDQMFDTREAALAAGDEA